MFTGEHERLLDEKGRLVLPPNFRRYLQEAAFIAKSLQAPCLMVYSSDEIQKVAERLIEQVQTKKVNADGCHLGQSDMKITDARKILGKKKINFRF